MSETVWNWIEISSCCQPENGCFSLLGISTMVRKFSLSGDGVFSLQQVLCWSEMTQCFCITSKSIEHVFFAALQGKKWAHQCTPWEKNLRLWGLTTAVVSCDLLQFQMADLIPWITLGVEMLTGPSLQGHKTVIINSKWDKLCSSSLKHLITGSLSQIILPLPVEVAK